jgi:AcrR family transcriptional regulator
MTRGRPKSFDPETVLEQAMQVFWQHGYEATSLQDLLAATGLSKSSLYQAYSNKQALFEAAFGHYAEQRSRKMHARMLQAPSPLEFLRGWLLSVLDDVGPDGNPRGCMLVNVANEFSQTNPAVAELLQRGVERIQRNLREALQRAQACGELNAAANVDALASYLHCVMSGLRTQVKGGAAKPAIEAVVDLSMSTLR